MDKIKALLPIPKILNSEWVLISTLLEGHEDAYRGTEVRFEKGVCYTCEIGSEEWEWQEPIREMDVDPSDVRAFLNNFKYSEFDWQVSDAEIELRNLFTSASWCPMDYEANYSTLNH